LINPRFLAKGGISWSILDGQVISQALREGRPTQWEAAVVGNVAVARIAVVKSQNFPSPKTPLIVVLAPWITDPIGSSSSSSSNKIRCPVDLPMPVVKQTEPVSQVPPPPTPPILTHNTFCSTVLFMQPLSRCPDKQPQLSISDDRSSSFFMNEYQPSLGMEGSGTLDVNRFDSVEDDHRTPPRVGDE
jgi:hypothetical protein